MVETYTITPILHKKNKVMSIVTPISIVLKPILLPCMQVNPTFKSLLSKKNLYLFLHIDRLIEKKMREQSFLIFFANNPTKFKLIMVDKESFISQYYHIERIQHSNMLTRIGPLNQIPITQHNLFKVYTTIHHNQPKIHSK